MASWITVLLPFIYLGLLVGSLATFSSLYRRRKLTKTASLEPWFNPHLQRNIYLSLLHIEPETDGVKVPESVLKAALLRRATEDIHRIVAIRSQKPALASLLQRGSVGDELWQRFLRAEKEIEEELRDVVNEANAFAPGWGQAIFQSANEMAANQMIKNRMDEVQGQLAADREWWDKRKPTGQSGVPKAVEEQKVQAAEAPAAPPSTVSRSSDDDTVLVESGGPAAGAQGVNANKNKKKAGKK